MAKDIHDMSLAAYTKAFDERVAALATSVKALEQIEGKIGTHLHGTHGKTPGVAMDEGENLKRGLVSLESIKQEFDAQLNALEQVTKTLFHRAEGNGKVPGVAIGLDSGLGSPRND